MTPDRAADIAFIAHTACRQTRADGVTPFIDHPRRVADLTAEFYAAHMMDLPVPLRNPEDDLVVLSDVLVCAYLHDVVEDTGLTFWHLWRLGATRDQLDLIDRLTKPDREHEVRGLPKEQAQARRREWELAYLQRISERFPAILVKAADRAANLEDALKQLHEPVEKLECKRWLNYAVNTRADVLPMYKLFPGLRSEIEKRLEAFEAELPAAQQRRADHVAAKCAAKGIAS